jgi:hypothetical protein
VQLRDVLLANVRGSSRMTSYGGWFPLMARTPNQASSAPGLASTDFINWCQLRGGQHYRGNHPDLPAHVDATRKAVERITPLAGEGMASQADWCSVGEDVYVLETRRVSIGMGGNPPAPRYNGYTFAWLSSQLLKEKSAAAEAALARSAAMTGEVRQQREAEAKQANAARAEAAAQKSAYLKHSPKGTQLVCTARQMAGSTIADLWYGCEGADLGVMTFAAFAQHGWRAASQTRTPVQLASGNVEHDVAVTFEKIR